MSLKQRQYGNPKILKELAKQEEVNVLQFSGKREEIVSQPVGLVMPSITSTAPTPVRVPSSDKVKPTKKKKRSKVINVYINNSDAELLSSIRKEFGYNKSQSFKIALHYFARKHKKNTN